MTVRHPFFLTAVAICLLAGSAAAAETRSCRILLPNDDGIQHPGVRAAYYGLSKVCDVLIVAPAANMSGMSHAILNTRTGTKVTETTIEPGLIGYAVEGSPAEAAALGLMVFGKDRPFDIVVSGINEGHNTGILNLYSGTVNAAVEGAVRGKPSIAFSADGKDYSYAAAFAQRVVHQVLDKGLPAGIALNVNIPAPPVKGVVVVRSAGESYSVEGFDPVSSEGAVTVYKPRIRPIPAISIPGDAQAFQQGMVTISPLLVDRTAYQSMDYLKGWELQLRP